MPTRRHANNGELELHVYNMPIVPGTGRIDIAHPLYRTPIVHTLFQFFTDNFHAVMNTPEWDGQYDEPLLADPSKYADAWRAWMQALGDDRTNNPRGAHSIFFQSLGSMPSGGLYWNPTWGIYNADTLTDDQSSVYSHEDDVLTSAALLPNSPVGSFNRYPRYSLWNTHGVAVMRKYLDEMLSAIISVCDTEGLARPALYVDDNEDNLQYILYAVGRWLYAGDYPQQGFWAATLDDPRANTDVVIRGKTLNQLLTDFPALTTQDGMQWAFGPGREGIAQLGTLNMERSDAVQKATFIDAWRAASPGTRTMGWLSGVVPDGETFADYTDYAGGYDIRNRQRTCSLTHPSMDVYGPETSLVPDPDFASLPTAEGRRQTWLRRKKNDIRQYAEGSPDKDVALWITPPGHPVGGYDTLTEDMLFNLIDYAYKIGRCRTLVVWSNSIYGGTQPAYDYNRFMAFADELDRKYNRTVNARAVSSEPPPRVERFNNRLRAPGWKTRQMDT